MKALMDTQHEYDNMFERHAFKFMKGFYYLIDGNADEGISLMKTVLKIFRLCRHEKSDTVLYCEVKENVP
jgi:hypothetical protein